MGAINKQEFEKILHEMKALEQYINEQENGNVGIELAENRKFAAGQRRLRE